MTPRYLRAAAAAALGLAVLALAPEAPAPRLVEQIPAPAPWTMHRAGVLPAQDTPDPKRLRAVSRFAAIGDASPN